MVVCFVCNHARVRHFGAAPSAQHETRGPSLPVCSSAHNSRQRVFLLFALSVSKRNPSGPSRRPLLCVGGGDLHHVTSPARATCGVGVSASPNIFFFSVLAETKQPLQIRYLPRSAVCIPLGAMKSATSASLLSSSRPLYIAHRARSPRPSSTFHPKTNEPTNQAR